MEQNQPVSKQVFEAGLAATKLDLEAKIEASERRIVERLENLETALLTRIPRLGPRHIGVYSQLFRRASARTRSPLKQKFQSQLPRSADLIQRIEAAILAAASKRGSQYLCRLAE